MPRLRCDHAVSCLLVLATKSNTGCPTRLHPTRCIALWPHGEALWINVRECSNSIAWNNGMKIAVFRDIWREYNREYPMQIMRTT